jgi:carbon monoxide dehydrogenase subunit G
MELVNDFTVNSPIEETWATLTDVERIAPCLPGAQLQEIEGDTYRGVVKVKVGPIVANFKGEARFVEKDDVNHKAVLDASGRDTGNKGNAAAVITAQLEAVTPTSTKCTVATDLKITGKFAQFGRGAMQDISTKLLGEFVHNLEGLTTAAPNGESTSAPAESPTAPNGSARASTVETPAGDAAAAAPTVRKIDSAAAEPLDLGHVAGGAILKRLLPLIAGLLVVVLVLRRRRRRRR